MEYNLHIKMEKIDQFADKSGKWLNKKISKIIVGVFFGIILIFFGFLTFSSRFVQSLFGVRRD